MDVYKAIGRRVAALRRERGLTQEQVAEGARTSTAYLARIEAGAKRPTVEMLAAVARALDVPLWALFAPPRLTRGERAWLAADRELAEAVAGLSTETIAAVVALVRRLRAG